MDLQFIVISFQDSPRRERVSANLNATQIRWRFFDALREPSAHLPQYDEAEALRFWGRSLSQSEIGCAASHVAVLDQAAKSPPGSWTLVIEDDVALDPSFNYDALVRLCQVARIGYLRLYARHLARSRHVVWLGQRELTRFARAPMGTQAYLISSQSARAFVDSVRTIARPIDWEMDRFWHNGLRNYALFPFPCIELTTASSIKKQAESGRWPSAQDRAAWFVWKSKEALRRLGANIYLRSQDRAIRQRLEAQPIEFR